MLLFVNGIAPRTMLETVPLSRNSAAMDSSNPRVARIGADPNVTRATPSLSELLNSPRVERLEFLECGLFRKGTIVPPAGGGR